MWEFTAVAFDGAIFLLAADKVHDVFSSGLVCATSYCFSRFGRNICLSRMVFAIYSDQKQIFFRVELKRDVGYVYTCEFAFVKFRF